MEPTSTAPAPQALSVSQLNQRAKQTLERDVGDVWVEGELSNVSRPASGHIYFTLKDDRAQIRCALFRQRARFVAAPMRDGDQVKLRGRVSLFEPRGDYQLIAEAVQAAGLGELLAAFERLKAQLEGEGVFANARPLPLPPRKILILSSATGAAIRDVLAVLAARWPLADVTLIPVPVQGADAAPAMISALGLLNRQARLDPELDVVLITRGGGSLEDLWAFNNEHLARAIFHSRLPVMSAVGHEVDVTLADYAADRRAPTPSAAAERLVPDQHALKRQLTQAEQRLQRAMQARLERDSQRLDTLRARLRHPGEQLARQRQYLTALQQRLHRAIQHTLAQQKAQTAQLTRRLASQDMKRLHRADSERVSSLQRRLANAMQRLLETRQARLHSAARELNAVSPLAVLGRGYAIAQDAQGQVVRRADDTQPGQRLTLRLGEGRLSVDVKRRYKK
ncbi:MULTISPECIES: exodeoxyribonuclease VII large subunit [Halomonadaceae]|uniref:Exodeoxyribonuclease 7 large subunit n=1 Tax=Vreelandella piezotolerans TaxID=2609667 RepID=A0ABQ6XCP9_9GAMM|nr:MULTISPECIES: exodeoxyribonuclease VII large subunit [Halomonas]KAE8439766.1 exodeoxyribonuclease VII large subunit [Halomonas piezotolerans]MCG7589244.1 exodeoxyribonuclease VII large subunit [Halomonas sp. McD50-5]MCG7615405.1 exodeoxyribonuclease VII large subunit [Halomonas sp. McD50-4]QJA23304.1 exodeoxyribonuclease VII large subunit [Halomonas piezotolerans]TNH19749.1 exodeoxyribonuclease VII large subunit [Halomonas sp. BL6]